MLIRFAALCLLSVAVACASRSGPNQFASGPVGVNQPSLLLSKARDQQAKEGCAKAAPAYRIVSSYGDGYEIAQYELGACLLGMSGESDEETALFRQEALFWLNRAAWAGNPRAQLKLAEILSGAPAYAVSHMAPDPSRAMTWAAVYEANGARETFGLKPVGPLVMTHLQSALPVEAMEAAKSRASTFRKIAMREFVPPARDPQAREGGFDVRPGAGTGRRRRPQ